MSINPKFVVLILIAWLALLLAFAVVVNKFQLDPGPRQTTSNPKITIIQAVPRDAVTTARLRP